MRLFIKIIFIFVCIIIITNTYVLANEVPKITAQAALIMDIDTGEVIYSKNGYKKMFPASTTKIITCIMGLEMGELQKFVKISENAARVGEASIYLKAGNEIKLLDLIKGALIKSGNDAAFAIGECIAGSESLFVYLMNKKVFLLGGKSSHFCNTNGLPNNEHVTSAYDLAIVARYAMHNNIFSKIVRTKREVIKFKNGEGRILRNTNRLLWTYEYATGIKTGTTNQAGKCLVASAEKDGKNMLVVILKSMDRYGDASKLLDYALNNYENIYYPKGRSFGHIFVKGGKKNFTTLKIMNDLAITFHKNYHKEIEVKIITPDFLDAPLYKGQIVGRAEILLNNKIVDFSHLIVTEDIKATSILSKLLNIIN